jgi:hypothetical protein
VNVWFTRVKCESATNEARVRNSGRITLLLAPVISDWSVHTV